MVTLQKKEALGTIRVRRGGIGAWSKSASFHYGPGLSRKFLGVQASKDSARKVLGFSISHKQFVIALMTLVLLIMAPFGIGYATIRSPQSSCLQSLEEANQGLPCKDPATLIWRATAPTGSLVEFKTVGATYASGCVTGINCVSLLPTATRTAIALSNLTIGDLGIISGKTLAFHPSWFFSGAGGGSWSNGNSWGYYLTTNKTLPTQNGYDPSMDPNVVFQVKVACSLSSCNPAVSQTYTTYEYALRVLGFGDTINSERFGNACAGQVSGVNGTAGDCFDSAITGVTATGNPIAAAAYLNYTAATNPTTNCAVISNVLTGTACSWVLDSQEGSGVNAIGVQDFPFFTFSGTQYYIGLYALFNNAAATQWTFDTYPNNVKGNMDVFSFVPTPTATVLSPNIDSTGGLAALWGDEVRGWSVICNTLGIGTFCGQVNSQVNSAGASLVTAVSQGFSDAIAFFVQYFPAAIQIALNYIGNFFGWGNIGTQFVSFVNGVIQYFTTGLATALNWLLNLILRSLDLISILSSWFNFYIGGLLNLLANLLNVIGFIVTLAGKFVLFYGTSYVLIEILLFIWYSASDGLPGWQQWFETSKWFSFISYDIFERMINFGISSITWLIGRIPTFDGTVLPELPTVNISGGPSWPSSEIGAAREGNVFAFMGIILGMITLIYYETSGLPGSIGALVPAAAPQANAGAGFLALFYILVEVLGILFVLFIPMQLVKPLIGESLTEGIVPQFSFEAFRVRGPRGKFVRMKKTGKDKTASRSGRSFLGVSSVRGRIAGRKGRTAKEALSGKVVIHKGLGLAGLRPSLTRRSEKKRFLSPVRQKEQIIRANIPSN